MTAETLSLLLARFAELSDRLRRIVAPSYRGRRGSPVLFGRELFADLSQIEGDVGGRQLLPRFPEKVACVELEEELPLLDADTPEELQQLGGLYEGAPR